MADHDEQAQVPLVTALPEAQPDVVVKIGESYCPAASAAEIGNVIFDSGASASIAPTCEVTTAPAPPGADSASTE